MASRRAMSTDARDQDRRVDVHVGLRLRLRRTLMGMTQEGTATVIGVSFQQLQKYESGANRVSASRLVRLAELLEVPVVYFFEGLPGVFTETSSEIAPEPDRELMLLCRNYLAIEDAETRRVLLNLIESIGDTGEPSAVVPRRPRKLELRPPPV